MPDTIFMEAGTDATQGFEFYETNTCTSESSVVNTGPRSINCTHAGGPNPVQNFKKGAVLADAGRRISFYFRLSALPSSGAVIAIAAIGDSSDQELFSLNVNSSGVLLFRDRSNNQEGSDGSTISIDTWFRACISYTITSSTVNELRLFLDGTSDISVTDASLDRASGVNLFIGILDGTSSTSITMYVDDIYVDDSSALTDTGNVKVTAKLPNANNTNNFDANVGNNPANRYENVNERALSETNGWQDATAASTSTFGKTDVGGTSEALSGENKRFCKFTAGSDLGSVASISAYLNRTGGGPAYAVTAGIYTDNSGAPDALVANSEILLTSDVTRNSPQWYTATYSTAPSLTAGNVYWLGVIADKDILTYYDSGSSNQQASNADTYADGLADPFGTPTYASQEMSTYVTYNISPDENYGIQDESTGDEDLTGATLVARSAWIWAKKGSGAGSGEEIYNNGSTTGISLTTSSALYTDIADSATYPSNAAAAGLKGIAGAADSFLYECGMLIAYIPGAATAVKDLLGVGIIPFPR